MRIETYVSSASLFEVKHPPEWRIEVEENETSVWKPGRNIAVTLSAFFHEGGLPENARKALGRFLKEQSVRSLQEGGSSPDRASAYYRDGDNDEWLATVVCAGPVLVLATVVAGRGSGRGSEDWDEAAGIVDSLSIREPRPG